MSTPSFGFVGLTDIKPGGGGEGGSPPDEIPPVIDAIAERRGFTSREPLVRKRRQMPALLQTDQLNLRAEVRDINRFVEWCERERMSYREGFAATRVASLR